MVLDGKSSQECPVNAGVLQGPILGPTLFQIYIHNPPDEVICDVPIYADDTTLYSKCEHTSKATTWTSFWTWIWSTKHYGLGQEVVCWFKFCEKSAGFVWMV